ncbi:MAG TPA: mechanosensitive ion channel domain-containing protein [Acetobacteraceae bacterium]|nr:mechanosensitive ion channel domain-containing protein [Acetobacteraceae bacterium]
MDSWLAASELHQYAHQAVVWARDRIFVSDTLLQLACMLLLGLVTLASARPLRRALLRQADRVPPGPLHPVATALARAGPSIVLLLLLWFARLAFNATHSAAAVLRTAESLVLVWVLIRLSSRLVRNEALARVIAVAAWAIAALNIAGLLGPVIGVMDAMAVPIGNYRLSLLLLVKGVITMALLIWLANTSARMIEHWLDRMPVITPVMRVLAGKLARLLLVVLAVLLALGSIGIDLTAFAVFSGAVGVGVGFGLQKVVSNLISGVILLLDRSIKPGDVIEVEDTYGFVNALNARYVAVRTRDGKEFLIPNEDLITQRVTNWSYSNDLIRLHVKVGISYQSDPHAAISRALEAAREVPRVLAEPEPTCLLVEFGGSTIDLELRCWINDPVNGMANVRSELMLRIWDLYQAHGIELPHPQRDITLRNPEALAAALQPRRGAVAKQNN